MVWLPTKMDSCFVSRLDFSQISLSAVLHLIHLNQKKKKKPHCVIATFVDVLE